MVVDVCHSRYMGGIDRKITILGQGWAKMQDPIQRRAKKG
jgi:hypothetical protein